MRSSTPEVAERDGEIVVEAPTARQALEEVTIRLGPRATIVEASKVTRGGIGGFFTREMIQLRAQPPAATYEGGDEETATTTAAEHARMDRLLTELSSQVGEQEETFATALRRHLGTPTPGAAQAPAENGPGGSEGAAPAGQEPPPLADGAMGFHSAMAAVRLGAGAPGGGVPQGHHAPAGTPHWTADRLLRLGVPAALLAGWRDPGDDLEGLVAFSRLVAPLCRPLPAGPALVAGPRAHRLAGWLGAPVVSAAEVPPPAGIVCVRLNGGERSRAWLDHHGQGRWLHLVAGGSGWQRLLLAYPLAVSWWGAEALPDAVRVSSELGVPLAYGSAGARGARLEAATPTVVAVAVRDLLVGR